MVTTDTGSHPTREDAPVFERRDGAPGEPRTRNLVASAQVSTARGAARPVRWWREILLGVVAYFVYAQARSLHGHSLNQQDARVAARHGRGLFDFEKWLHLDWERGLQRNLLAYKGFLQVIGGFYGGAHFVVTIAVLLWLLFKRPELYRFWRSILFAVTMISVVIFSLYPAAPPRLLIMPGATHPVTVDTLDAVGGLWNYNHGVLEHISDPYAPMPSLHLGWATWVTLALWFALPAHSWRRRALVLLYPLAVYFTVVATGTHFVIDGVAGMALTAAVVYAGARIVLSHRARRLLRTGATGVTGLT